MKKKTVKEVVLEKKIKRSRDNTWYRTIIDERGHGLTKDYSCVSLVVVESLQSREHV